MFQGLASALLLAAAIYIVYSIYRWVKKRYASFGVEDEIDTAKGLKRAQTLRDENADVLEDAPKPKEPDAPKKKATPTKAKKAPAKTKAKPKAKTTKKKD